MSSQAPRLSIFHPGALGDGILALAAVRALKQQFSGHFLTWFGQKELGELFVAAGEVHQSYSFNAFTFLAYAGGHGSQQKIFSALLAHCDRAVGWMRDAEGLWQRFFNAVGVKHYILHSPHDHRLWQYHMADRYVETLQVWFPIQQVLNPIPENLLLPSEPEAVYESQISNDPLIILHPGSGNPNKCAPSALWAELINKIGIRPHREIILLGGPADIEMLQRVQELLTEVKPTILTDLDLLSVGRKLQQAQLYIGNDSGLSHLAAQLGIPSILFFIKTDPAKWAPRGKHIKVMGSYDICGGKRHSFPISSENIIEKAEEILNRKSTSKGPASGNDDFSHMPCLG